MVSTGGHYRTGRFGRSGGHTLAVASDGSLWGWGRNEYGQLGDGANPQETPIQIGNETDWVAVEAGWATSFGIKSNGALWAWGANRRGELGNGTFEIPSSPTQIGLDRDWASVEAGSGDDGGQVLALKADGSLWAWGLNSSGELGDGSKADRNVPVRIGANTTWKAIAAWAGRSAGLQEDGSLWTWGDPKAQDDPSLLLPRQLGSDHDWRLPPSSLSFLPPPPVRLTHQAVDNTGRFWLTSTTTNHAYYVLYRGFELTGIVQVVDVSLADCGAALLIDATPVSSKRSAFYRVAATPLDQPLDLDGDGIDDVYELRHAHFLNPLNPSDAGQDFDADGRPNLQEYLAGTNPEGQ